MLVLLLWAELTQQRPENSLNMSHKPLTLDKGVGCKISKQQFFQNINNSFYRVTEVGLEPYKNFEIFFSQNMVARSSKFLHTRSSTDKTLT